MRPARKRTRVTLCRLDARDTAALTHEQATRPRHRRPERQEDRGRQAEPDTHRVSERHNGTVSISQQAPPPASRRAGLRLLHLQNISQTILSRADIAAFAQEHGSAFICGCEQVHAGDRQQPMCEFFSCLLIPTLQNKGWTKPG